MVGVVLMVLATLLALHFWPKFINGWLLPKVPVKDRLGRLGVAVPDWLGRPKTVDHLQVRRHLTTNVNRWRNDFPTRRDGESVRLGDSRPGSTWRKEAQYRLILMVPNGVNPLSAEYRQEEKLVVTSALLVV